MNDAGIAGALAGRRICSQPVRSRAAKASARSGSSREGWVFMANRELPVDGIDLLAGPRNDGRRDESGRGGVEQFLGANPRAFAYVDDITRLEPQIGFLRGENLRRIDFEGLRFVQPAADDENLVFPSAQVEAAAGRDG